MKNRFTIFDDHVVIYIKRKNTYLKCLIDLEDLEKVNSFKGTWSATVSNHTNVYVHCVYKKKRYKLHRLLTNAPDGVVVDHINRNTLDNRRANLRLCTHRENMQNSKVFSTSSSGVRNVVRDKQSNKWVVRFRVDGKRYYFGRYDDVEEAEKVAVRERKKLMPFSTY